MTNIKCDGNKEIDLLVINPITNQKYRVESSVRVKGFSLRETDTYRSKGKWKGLPHGRGLDTISESKFNHPAITRKIRQLFGDSKYHKVLVIWNTEDNFSQLPQIAEQKYGIEVMDLRGMIHEFTHKKITSGSRDDVLRTMELVSLVEHEEKAFLTRINKLGEVRRDRNLKSTRRQKTN